MDNKELEKIEPIVKLFSFKIEYWDVKLVHSQFFNEHSKNLFLYICHRENGELKEFNYKVNEQ